MWSLSPSRPAHRDVMMQGLCVKMKGMNDLVLHHYRRVNCYALTINVIIGAAAETNGQGVHTVWIH